MSLWKNIHDNAIKDNITVVSLNFSQNNGTIRILTHILAKTIVNYQQHTKFDTVMLFLCIPNLCFSSHSIV